MYRYIIIDDEMLTRKGTIEKLSPLSDILQCIGEAENGEHGLALVDELHPDLVITDMKMPVMDGLSLLPVMLERYPDISLIVINGYQDFEYMRQAIRGISSLFWSEKQKVLYGISSLHTSLADLSAAYKETARALDQSTDQSPENIWEYQNENLPPKRLSWPHTDELIFCVESGNTKEAGQLADALFSYYDGISGLSLADIKYNCYHICNQLRYMISYSIPEFQVIRTEADIQATLDTIFSVSGLHTYYRSYFTNIAQNLAAQDIYGDADLVNNVKTYIEHYHRNNISVELAASLFHVNRSYLSHIFKRKLGMSFIDYLNQVRISHAKELLTSSDKKMYQIALLSGYNNVRYFFRVFKKVEGVTPEQFRKTHK